MSSRTTGMSSAAMPRQGARTQPRTRQTVSTEPWNTHAFLCTPPTWRPAPSSRVPARAVYSRCVTATWPRPWRGWPTTPRKVACSSGRTTVTSRKGRMAKGYRRWATGSATATAIATTRWRCSSARAHSSPVAAAMPEASRSGTGFVYGFNLAPCVPVRSGEGLRRHRLRRPLHLLAHAAAGDPVSAPVSPAPLGYAVAEAGSRPGVPW
jgi:hypothetical protein